MLSIDLPQDLEKRLTAIVQVNYHGNWSVALSSLLQLPEKSDWKAQLIDDVTAIRTEIDQQGGLNEKTITEAINHYRQSPVGA